MEEIIRFIIDICVFHVSSERTRSLLQPLEHAHKPKDICRGAERRSRIFRRFIIRKINGHSGSYEMRAITLNAPMSMKYERIPHIDKVTL